MSNFEGALLGVHGEVSLAFDCHLVDHFDCFDAVAYHGACESYFRDGAGSEAGGDANVTSVGVEVDREDGPAFLADLLDEGDTVVDGSSPGGRDVGLIEVLLNYFFFA